MAWSFDHFLLRFHVSGNSRPLNGRHAHGGTESRREEICRMIVYNWKNSPVEEYDRPSHIASKKQWRLGNASAIASRTMERELAYLQCNGHLTWYSGHKCNLLGLVHTYQPFEWNMQEGGILYGSRWPWLDYISTDVIRQRFYSVVCRPKNLINIKHLILSVQYHRLKLWWNLILAETDESQLSRWVVRSYANWSNSAMARIILQVFLFNSQLVTNRFWKVSHWYSRSQFYINQWILGGVMLITVVFEKRDDW